MPLENGIGSKYGSRCGWHDRCIDGAWSLSPVPLTLAAVAVLLFAQGSVRLRRRTAAAHASFVASALFLAGVLVSLFALISPVDSVGEDQLLTAHMLQHLLLGDIGPLFLVLGLRGPLGVFYLPPRLLRVVARGPVRALVDRLLRPRVSLAFWLAAIGGWHVPTAYDAALAHPFVHALEHFCFAFAGVLAWTQIVRGRRLSLGQRAAFAFALLVASGILAEVLVALQPIYPHYAAVRDRPFGWTAGQDQSRAALLMMAEQIATLGTAMTFLIRAHVDRVAAELPSG